MFSFPIGRTMLPNYNNSSMNSNSNSKQILSAGDSLKVQVKELYIGKVTNHVSYVEIKYDRILFANIANDIAKNKYNITIPYNEITALRYCFCPEVNIIVIQPIRESYKKFTQWLNLTSGLEPVPENFIMIQFNDKLDGPFMNKLKATAIESKNSIKIIEINPVFALNYLKIPNKSVTRNIGSGSNTFSHFLVGKKLPKEVIHLDDEDDDGKETEKIDDKKRENSILDQAILRYPKDQSKPIILYGNDLNCLGEGQYLNDNIMNFYLKYFQYNGNLSQGTMDKIHIYDALFATHMLSYNSRKRKIALSNNLVVCSYDTLSQAYHSVLKKWTKDIDIFAKDFLLIPLVKDGHWFLIILCYIGNLITEHSGVVPSKSQMMKKPTIIFMDSLVNNLNRTDICRSMMSYLSLELKEKRGIDMTTDMFNYRCLSPKVPQQYNSYDCGLFVLEYIERFLKSPEEIFLTLVDDNTALHDWFDSRTLNTKRAKIQQTILNLLPPDDAKQLERELTKIQLDGFRNGINNDSIDAPAE